MTQIKLNKIINILFFGFIFFSSCNEDERLLESFVDNLLQSPENKLDSIFVSEKRIDTQSFLQTMNTNN